MHVFREFVIPIPDANGVIDEENGPFDASGIISLKCYETWIKTRKGPPTRPEKAFQRTLSAHITGLDGRKPFSPQEEAAVLSVIRQPQRWPCFNHAMVRLGMRGFRALGFHEKANGATLADLPALESKATSCRVFRMPPPAAAAASASEPQPRSNAFMFHQVPPQQQQQQPQFASQYYAAPPPPQYPSMDMYQQYQLEAAAAAVYQQQQDAYRQNVDYAQPPRMHYPMPAPAPKEEDASNKRVKLLASWFVEDQETRFLKAASQRLMDGTPHAWQQIQSLARMNLFAKGWTYNTKPTKEQALQVLLEHDKAKPCTFALVMDILERDWTKRVLAANDLFKQSFGPVCRDEGGVCENVLAANEEAWKLLEAVVESFRNAGEETSTQLKVTTRSFSESFDVKVKVLADQHLVLMYGTPAD